MVKLFFDDIKSNMQKIKYFFPAITIRTDFQRLPSTKVKKISFVYATGFFLRSPKVINMEKLENRCKHNAIFLQFYSGWVDSK